MLSALDWICAALLLASLLLGAWRGLVFELMSIAGWVVAFLAARWSATVVGDWLPMGESPEPLRYAAGFVLVFIAVAFLCGMLASLAGQMPATGGDTLYGPIKSFLIKASQGLHLETLGTGVHVTVLNPGYTLTEFHDVNGSRDQVSSAYPPWMWMDAARVARIGVDASEANRPSVTPGVMNNVMAGLARFLPDGLALRMVANHARRLERL